MTRTTEHAAGRQVGGHTFPRHWTRNVTPGNADELAVWIATNLRADRAAAGLDTDVRALRPGAEVTGQPPRRSRALDGRLALLALRAREIPPQ